MAAIEGDAIEKEKRTRSRETNEVPICKVGAECNGNNTDFDGSNIITGDDTRATIARPT